jgi:5-methyltetrahydrofolate--homocysteine methyltransferase
MHEVIRRYALQIQPGVPFMLDSTNPAVMEAGLKLAGGRCILNSMNLEDGEEKLGAICALAKKYGAAVVAGCIDEDKENAMARTRQRKLSIAQRIRDLAVDRFGLRDQDLMFDPLVLPVSTGLEPDRANALETIEGTRLISQHLPNCHTVVGLSNVSFGLKPAARVVLNSVFLHELRAAGLTGAIVHASKILPKNRIPEEHWNAALDLIYDRRREGFDPLTAFISLGEVDAGPKAEEQNLTIEETLKKHIIDGEKRNLIAHLDEARQKYSPLEIINNLLLEGMKVVGDLFGSGQMQLPFVLQSAETMKASVAHLEKFMEKTDGQSKGKIVLATVKGDVHDIGKNLVDIILTNNGYTVYNLGIKQPVSEILKAARDRNADAIGMSGLLVKSVGVMKENLQEMNSQGINMPVLLGGAALTRHYAVKDLGDLYTGQLFYCRDAFEGLHTMDRIVAGQGVALQKEQRDRELQRDEAAAKAVKPIVDTSVAVLSRSEVATDNPIPLPPFWGRRKVTGIRLDHVFPYINPLALFVGQWGFKKRSLGEEEYDQSIEETARPVFEKLKARAVAEHLLEPSVVYGYFPVQSSGDDLIIYETEEFASCPCHPNPIGMKNIVSPIHPHGTPRERTRFTFPRQATRRRLCIADFFRSTDSGQYDVLGLSLVTVGAKASEVASELFAANQYQEMHYLNGFGVESAEALAESWHKRMRQELGFGSEDSSIIRELFQQKYRGSRYSFGYPACPNLEDRVKIVDLLDAASIGVTLSENYMLSPEQSTDALIVHHPQARYFDT